MKKLTKNNEAMRAKVAKDRRAAHTALQAAESAIFEQGDRVARRKREQAASRSRSGLGESR